MIASFVLGFALSALDVRYLASKKFFAHTFVLVFELNQALHSDVFCSKVVHSFNALFNYLPHLSLLLKSVFSQIGCLSIGLSISRL
jgi:hypothetical protein